MVRACYFGLARVSVGKREYGDLKVCGICRDHISQEFRLCQPSRLSPLLRRISRRYLICVDNVVVSAISSSMSNRIGSGGPSFERREDETRSGPQRSAEGWVSTFHQRKKRSSRASASR